MSEDAESAFGESEIEVGSDFNSEKYGMKKKQKAQSKYAMQLMKAYKLIDLAAK